MTRTGHWASTTLTSPDNCSSILMRYRKKSSNVHVAKKYQCNYIRIRSLMDWENLPVRYMLDDLTTWCRTYFSTGHTAPFHLSLTKKSSVFTLQNANQISRYFNFIDRLNADCYYLKPVGAKKLHLDILLIFFIWTDSHANHVLQRSTYSSTMVCVTILSGN